MAWHLPAARAIYSHFLDSRVSHISSNAGEAVAASRAPAPKIDETIDSEVDGLRSPNNTVETQRATFMLRKDLTKAYATKIF